MDALIPVAFGLTVMAAGMVFCVWALISAVARQRRAYRQVDESLDLSRHGLELSERAVELTEQMVRNQEEMIRLLRELAGREGGPTNRAASGGVRLPDRGPPATHE